MPRLSFDVAHMLAGLLVLTSFMMLYQDRLYALLRVLALHAFVLACAVAWQAHIQDAPHLYVTAGIALVFKATLVPWALQRIMVRLGIHREIETVVGIGITMLAGIFLVALSLEVMLPVTTHANPVAREDIALALSVVLIGLLIMVTRRNAVSQVVGFLSLENGVDLAAAGAQGMPLVVEISVAFSILIAFIVIGIFLFRIRERFELGGFGSAGSVPWGTAMNSRASWPGLGLTGPSTRARSGLPAVTAPDLVGRMAGSSPAMTCFCRGLTLFGPQVLAPQADCR